MVQRFGFKVSKTRSSSWRGTYNFELIAARAATDLSRENFERISADYLQNFLLDRSQSELSLHKVWLETYRSQIERSWATGA
jgi:hypothetical protein